MSIADRGFASLAKERLAEISAAGGRASHKVGHAYQWDEKTAPEAGRLGGIKSGEVRRRKSAEQKARACDGGGDDAS